MPETSAAASMVPNVIPAASGSDHAWDIVDTQLHFSRASIAPALLAMDALGIRSAVLDEFWTFDANGVERPYQLLPHGVTRPLALTVAAAAYEHPSRFSYMLRVDYRDPQVDFVVGGVAADPGGRAIRVFVPAAEQDQAAFRAGGFSPIFDAARKHELPVLVLNPGKPRDLALYAAEYADVSIVVDHTGMPFPDEHREVDLAVFDEVLALAAYPNVALKWSHAAMLFKVRGYPLDDLTPFLLGALREFGKERVMWASDITMNTTGHSWADLLFSIRENSALSLEERQWILGRAARRILRWP